MNIITYKGKTYREFKLPDVGMFFNRGTMGIVWDEDVKIKQYELELIYPINFSTKYRVKTHFNSSFEHCALLTDEVIDPIRHPTVEDVERRCFVEVINPESSMFKFIFMATEICMEGQYIAIGSPGNPSSCIRLKDVKFICYASDFYNFVEKNKKLDPSYMNINDIQSIINKLKFIYCCHT